MGRKFRDRSRCRIAERQRPGVEVAKQRWRPCDAFGRQPKAPPGGKIPLERYRAGWLNRRRRGQRVYWGKPTRVLLRNLERAVQKLGSDLQMQATPEGNGLG